MKKAIGRIGDGIEIDKSFLNGRQRARLRKLAKRIKKQRKSGIYNNYCHYYMIGDKLDNGTRNPPMLMTYSWIGETSLMEESN